MFMLNIKYTALAAAACAALAVPASSEVVNYTADLTTGPAHYSGKKMLMA